MTPTTETTEAAAPSRPDSRQLNGRELAAWKGMLAAHRDITAAIDEELKREHEISLGFYAVLLLLAEAPERSMRMGQLADGILISHSGLTRLVDRMVARGLVERHTCSEDRRGTWARLTEDGDVTFRQARPTHLAAIREHFVSRLDDDDLDSLASAWKKLEDPELGPGEQGC